MNWMLPKINKSELKTILWYSFWGAMLGGVYGVVHDQITYSISPEYFTKLKFNQFRYLDFGLSDRFYVGTIGFFTTWWMGFIIGWFLSRRNITGQSKFNVRKKIIKGFCIVALVSIIFAVAAGVYGYGVELDFRNWSHLIKANNIQDTESFVRVAYIHNASYAGSFVGLLLVLVFNAPVSTSIDQMEDYADLVKDTSSKVDEFYEDKKSKDDEK